MKKRKNLVTRILGIVGLILLVYVILNYQSVADFLRGSFYSPSLEMSEIRDKLGLTKKGETIFNASRPELNKEDEFNANCYSFDAEEAILGCYTEQNIFVYHIENKELAGILELTTAHELLHAVYERMSFSERDKLREILEKTYLENKETLGEEIDSYNSSEQLEEIYVRLGTEVKKLPKELEEHYAKIFQDQDKIVSFYDSYIKVFRKIEEDLKTLENGMKTLNDEINQNLSEYENGVRNLNIEIDRFNQCAEIAGCFTNDYEFYLKRSELLSAQDYYASFYDQIETLVNEYNDKVVEYNNIVIKNEKLQKIVNSHVRVEEL